MFWSKGSRDAPPQHLRTAFCSPAPRSHAPQDGERDSLESEYLEALLKQHRVPGVSCAILTSDVGPQRGSGEPRRGSSRIETMCAGIARKNQKMGPETWLQQASLSKTVTATFAHSFYSKRNISLTTPVLDVLERLGSPLRLETAPSVPRAWIKELQLAHLVNHTGLGLHYVPGIPTNVAGGMPPVLDLLRGKPKLGYPKLVLHKRPGTAFSYSGHGFMLLQHILELEHGGKPIADILEPWLASCGVRNIGFDQNQPWKAVGRRGKRSMACGYRDDGKPVKGTRLMFPPTAAGAHGTPTSLCKFLFHVANAYHLPSGEFSGPIPSDSARAMLDDTVDLGAFDFMHAEIGFGVFIARAGPNRFMLHQAANDGFRGLFLVCFDGPDAGNGFVILSNGDNNAMFLNCQLCNDLLQRLGFKGVDRSLLSSNSQFSTKNFRQEEIVNLGIKELVLKSFVQPMSKL